MIRVNSVLRNKAIEFQDESVKQGIMYINLVMDDVESLIANLSGIDEVRNALVRSSGETSYDKLTTQATIGYILSGYTNLKGLVSIDLFSLDGAHYHVGETLNANNVNNDILAKLYSETRDSEGFANWSGIEPNINLDSEYQNVITATKILSASAGNSSAASEGLLVVSYDPNVFTEVFGTADSTLGYTLILDSRNRVVFHPDTSYIGHTLADDLSARIGDSKKDYFTQSIDGEDMFVVFDGTQKGDWVLAKFVPVEHIVASASSRTLIFFILLAMIIAVAVVHGVGLSRQFIQPIRRITDTFRLLQSGDFTNVSKLRIAHQDEIGELGNLFNSFIEAREDITRKRSWKGSSTSRTGSCRKRSRL
jgi:HAMP domain-containing protein